MSYLDLWEDLLQLVLTLDTKGLRRVGRKINYDLNTELVKDLGLTGDDAFHFMEAFASKFNVSKGDYWSSNYFESEGLWFIFCKKPGPTMPINLGMLLIAANQGVWHTRTLKKAYEENNGIISGATKVD